jgi:hypothetical protein
MIEPYHYAGFSVQTAMAKEQRDRDATDELIRLRKTPRYCGAERTSFWRMPKIELQADDAVRYEPVCGELLICAENQ